MPAHTRFTTSLKAPAQGSCSTASHNFRKHLRLLSWVACFRNLLACLRTACAASALFVLLDRWHWSLRLPPCRGACPQGAFSSFVHSTSPTLFGIAGLRRVPNVQTIASNPVPDMLIIAVCAKNVQLSDVLSIRMNDCLNICQMYDCVKYLAEPCARCIYSCCRRPATAPLVLRRE